MKLKFQIIKLKKKIKKAIGQRNIIIQALSQNLTFLKKNLQNLHGEFLPKSSELSMRYFEFPSVQNLEIAVETQHYVLNRKGHRFFV